VQMYRFFGRDDVEEDWDVVVGGRGRGSGPAAQAVDGFRPADGPTPQMAGTADGR